MLPVIESHLSEVVEELREERGVENLLGLCGENSVRTADHFFDKGFNPVIVFGWVDCVEADSPTTVREAYNQAVIHVWVRVDGYVVDAASEVSGEKGIPKIYTNSPASYNALETFEYNGQQSGSSLLETYETFATSVNGTYKQ